MVTYSLRWVLLVGLSPLCLPPLPCGSVLGSADLPAAEAAFSLDFISCRNVHRPIPIQNFKQYYEVKSASGNHAFFQEFEVRWDLISP